MLDYYSQKVVADNKTGIIASVSSYSCNGRTGYLSSSTAETSVNGVVVFDDMEAFCEPKGNLTIQYLSKPQDALLFGITDISAFYPSNISVFSFRECKNGEKYQDGSCVSCPNGTYSLIYAKDDGCRRCPKEGESCFKNKINLIPQ